MFVLMEGVILRRTYSGFGPFRRQHWDSEPFVWKLAKDGDSVSADGIQIRREDRANKIYVNGDVRGVPVYIADFDGSKPCQPADFSLLSVADVQLNGKATLVGSLKSASTDEGACAA